MNNIKVLEDYIINQIAAGEVVERPASIVKELVENSIDAGSTSITIETEEGGISLIRVSDNGRGIPKSQVLSAFTRHATSKIENMNDLEKVLTLGFRGEALSSISSISQVEIITKTDDEIMAKRLEIDGGKLINDQDIGSVTGTTIKVRNIFYNTPPRRKFLKKPGTESGYISDVVNKIALGHPDISFRYLVNGNEILFTSGNGDLKTVIFNVYGKDIAKGTIKIDYEKDEFKIHGYICKPEINRANRSYGNLFINGRFIKSDIVQSAIEEAYKTKLLTGKFPVYVLNLTINPKLVDVNVHPTKLEVRFSDEKRIFDLFYEATFNRLKDENLIPSHEIKEIKNPFVKNSFELDKNQNEMKLNFEKIISPEENDVFSEGRNLLKENKSAKIDVSGIVNSIYRDNDSNNSLYVEEARPSYDYKTRDDDNINNYTNNDISKNNVVEVKPNKLPFFNSYKMIGQFFNTYWMIEMNQSVYLVDQHAAHERVLFEKLTNKFKLKEVVTQRLVMPISIVLSEKEKTVLRDNMELLENFGFEIEHFPDDTYALKGVPVILKSVENSKTFTDILDSLSDKPNKIDSIYDTKIDNIASMSCKAAVKGNDKLSFIEAKNLIEDLLKLESPFTCPHGRPTIVELKKYEIEKMFKRVQ